jgi:hypothetical protein
MAGKKHDLLAMALVGYEAEKAKINAAIGEIRARLGQSSGAPAGAAPKKHTMSAAARKRIGAAQRKRWASVKKAQAAKKPTAAKKRKQSLLR